MKAQRAGAVALVVCAIASLVAGPLLGAGSEPTLVTAAATTTASATYKCAGTGIIGSGPFAVPPIPDQTTSVAITLPSSASANVAFDVGVDIGNLNLAAAPDFINLNSANILGVINVSGANNVVVPANNFVGNGASIDLVAGSTRYTASLDGPVTITVGNIFIQSGSTGFACTPVGPPASASITVGTTTTSTTTTTTQPTTSSTSTSTSSTTTSSTTTSSTTTSSTTTSSTTTSSTTTTTQPTTTSSTTTSSTTTSSTTTTQPPTTSTSTTSTTLPGGGEAVIVETERTVNYDCRLLNPDGSQFGSTKPPDSTVTAKVKVPDKVGVGGTFPVQLSLQPAPKNGPIALAPNVMNWTARLALGGGEPAELGFTGTNPQRIEANASFNLPQGGAYAVANATATAPAGQAVTLTLGQIDLVATLGGITVDTRCVPEPLEAETALVTEVKVVAGSVTVPTVTTTTTTTVPKNSFASCAEARAAGRGVIPRTSPAYSAALDPDKDGLACEANEGSASSTPAVAAASASARPAASPTRTAAAALALTGSSPLFLLGGATVLLLAGVALVGLGVLLARRRAGMAA